ncbi:MFS transporter [Bradyrhizobium sp. Leo121]|uniref:MFS transporter n=1 Tax=Bradyrhizobium sp. Leo121 TaxID=1571195 RepID=UPI001028A899|nr:MFS transporter [Bradyrhizobium sp. Leo121]
MNRPTTNLLAQDHTGLEPTPVDVRHWADQEYPSPRPFSFLISVGALYTSFGLIFGLMQGGLPPLLRARGVDLAAIGWTLIILLPFGLTFLWAPLVDAVRPIRTAPRIGWIVIMQIVILATLLVVSQGEDFQPTLLLSLGMLIAFAAATMDVALDALAALAIPNDVRPIAGGIKVAALSLGSMIGGGIFVVTFHHLGWQTTFQIAAAVTFLSTIPILFHRAWDATGEHIQPGRPRQTGFLRQPDTGRRLALLTLTTCVLVSLFSLNRVMLVDLGVSVETIGWIVGTGSPLCSLSASLIAIPIIRKAGPNGAILVFTGLSALAVGSVIAGALSGTTLLATAGSIAINAGTSGFYVIICSAILGWAKGDRPATGYAALYGVSRLVATILLIGLTRLVPLIGWPAFYGGALIALFMVSGVLRRALPRLTPTEANTETTDGRGN